MRPPSMRSTGRRHSSTSTHAEPRPSAEPDAPRSTTRAGAHCSPRSCPALRGALAADGPRILQVDASPAVLEFVSGKASPELSQVGAACPDHLVHTKRRPVFVGFDPEVDDAATLKARLVEEAQAFQERERAYVDRYRADGDELRDPSPRVILIEGVGLVSVGRTLKAAKLARDLYLRAIAVMRGASALGGFVSLDDEESFGIEYWPLELYKLSLAPKPGEFQGVVVLVTGGAGGIGSAVAQEFAAGGACIVVTDIDLDGAARIATGLGEAATGVRADVTDEASVIAAYREAALAFGGVDIVISNAGIASSAPITETSVELRDRNNDILARGYFLVAREAARLLLEQGTGGSIIFVGSKNALAPGKGAAAYRPQRPPSSTLPAVLPRSSGRTGCG